MLYYPQLTSGSVCQFPFGWRATLRTVSNELPGGASIRMSDPGGGTIRWQLEYSSLTDDEQSAMEQLFEAAEGRLETFTFLDPTDNLLIWSEDWTKPAWNTDALLQLTGGGVDPFGGAGAMQITNTAQTAQHIAQNFGGASWFQYCFSVYLRADSPSTVQLLQSSGVEISRTAATVSSGWGRFVKSGSLIARHDGLSFGVELPAGVRISAFGAQVEAQMAPGVYKKSTDHAGVYPRTRFDSDSLAITTDAPNRHSCTVNLVSGLA